MENSHIQWTDHTFNPWIGCTKVAPECKFCYAEEQQDHRYGRVKWGKGQPRSRTSPGYWKQPLRWNREADEEIENNIAFGKPIHGDYHRPRVFCASLADVFDEEVPDPWRWDLIQLIQATPLLDWLLLTKRPQNVAAMLGNWSGNENVWLGVSAGVDPSPLLEVPAAVHFLSCEPMLKPIFSVKGFDWVIFGGESGKHARFCNPEWLAAGVGFCREVGAAPFVKQLGSNCGLTLKHPKGGEMNEWPEALRVREFPNAHAPRLSPRPATPTATALSAKRNPPN